MNRVLVLAVALAFIAGFGFLTIAAIAEHGLSAAGVLSLFILVLLSVGVLGALRHPPD